MDAKKVGQVTRNTTSFSGLIFALSFVLWKNRIILLFWYLFLFFIGHGGTVFKPYQFKMEEIEGFKYRARVLRFLLT